MFSRKIDPKKALLAVFILGGNLLLFFKYALLETHQQQLQQQFDGSAGAKEVRSLPLQGGEPDAVYPLEMEDGGLDFPVIIYNRVPKTGSTTFANIAYKLTSSNNFNMLHINVTYKNMHHLNILDQQRFVRNISLWTEKYPAIYHGHLYYLEFTRFGYRNPIYINIVRDPIDRLVSYYYFLRYGDDYRPKLKRASSKDNRTLDQCLVMHGKDCVLEKVLWIQIPFFCGHSIECLRPGRWALEQAKTNLLNRYLLVGVTDHLEEFVALLEVMLPQYFSGAYDLYKNTELGYLRKTKEKITPSEQSLQYIRQSEVYQLEQEFYEFAKSHFEFLAGRTHTRIGDRIKINGPVFKYEKIFPRTDMA